MGVIPHPYKWNKPLIFNNLYFLNELQTSYKKDGIIDFNACRVTLVFTSQTLSSKKGVTNELRTMDYSIVFNEIRFSSSY